MNLGYEPRLRPIFPSDPCPLSGIKMHGDLVAIPTADGQKHVNRELAVPLRACVAFP
jgi:hypothetical protein